MCAFELAGTISSSLLIPCDLYGIYLAAGSRYRLYKILCLPQPSSVISRYPHLVLILYSFISPDSSSS